MSILYIIGNGFDLYHQLNTRYSDFASHLEIQNKRIFDELNQYYYMIQNSDLWADFEANLSNLDTELVLDNLSDYLPGSFGGGFQDREWHAFQIEIEMLVDRLTTELKSEFKKFIVNACNAGARTKEHINFKPNSTFISFNYSNTLEKLYKIKNTDIFYIHGSAFKNDSIILGHGVEPSESSNTAIEPSPSKGLSEEGLERWHQDMSDNYDYAYEQGISKINNYLRASFKNAAEIINENIDHFNSLQKINTVVILGHSMSDVDIPYFEEISNNVKPNASWFISYYSDDEYDDLYSSAQHIVQSNARIELFKMDDFNLSKII